MEFWILLFIWKSSIEILVISYYSHMCIWMQRAIPKNCNCELFWIAYKFSFKGKYKDFWVLGVGRLRVFTALIENQSSVPSTYIRNSTRTFDFSFRDSKYSSGFYRHCILWQTHRDNHTYAKQKKWFKLFYSSNFFLKYSVLHPA